MPALRHPERPTSIFAFLNRRLIESGADPGLISCNGELPIDLAEEDSVSSVLRTALKERQIDVEEARNSERDRMLADIAERRRQQKQSLKLSDFDDVTDPNTKATPLHVAAAKVSLSVCRETIYAVHRLLCH